MEPDKQALEAWKRGVPLGFAWLVFADKRNAQRYQEAPLDGSHSSIQISLEMDLVARLEYGDLQAIGIEGGSDPRAVFIPPYYFSRAAEINWERGTVADFGTKFHEVRVEGPRMAVDEPSAEPVFVDPRLVRGEPESAEAREPAPPKNPGIRPEPQSSEDALRSEPAPEKHEEAHAPSKTPGRPSKVPEIERAIDILLERGVDLANMPRRKAYKAVRACAAKELNSNVKLGFADPVIQRSLFERFGRRR